MMFTKVRNVKTPNRGTPDSAGIDFFVPDDFGSSVDLCPGESINIPSGIKLKIPHGYAGIFFNKSGVAIKGLQVGACVIDSDYRGEVHLNVHNHSDRTINVSAGQKLVQMLIMPVDGLDPHEISVEEYNRLSPTKRGEGGFGSTGDK